MFNYVSTKGEADNFRFSDKKKIQLVVFKYGFTFSLTNFLKKGIEFYDVANNRVINKLGYQRVQRTFEMRTGFPWLRKDNIIRKTLPLDEK